MIGRALLITMAAIAVASPAWAQVSGVRGISGGVAALHNLVGPETSLYIDGQGTVGYLNSTGPFETYNFRTPTPNSPSWIGSMMTLGPRLAVGLISGGNQGFFSGRTGTQVLVSSPTVFPSPPRELPPLPEIESSILEEIP